MGMTGMTSDLMAPLQLQPIRPTHLNALSLADMRPLTRVTIVTLAVPAETLGFAASPDTPPVSREERRDIVVLDLPVYRPCPEGFYIPALVHGLDRYTDAMLREGTPHSADTEQLNLANIGVMPHIALRDNGRLLWEPRTYTTRTLRDFGIRTSSGRAIPEPFEDEEPPIG